MIIYKCVVKIHQEEIVIFKKILVSLSVLVLALSSLFLPVQNVQGNTASISESDTEWLPPEIDREQYEALLEELGLEEDIPFEEDIPTEVLEKMENSEVLQEMALEGNQNVEPTIMPYSIKVIKLGKSIKQQGYMGNHDLRNYVAYVDKNSSRLGWAALVSGAISYYGLYSITVGALMQFGTGGNFETVKKQAYAGRGMGWVHMYAAGPNTLSVIPRRDFSSQFILYKK